MSRKYYRVLRADGTEFHPRLLCGTLNCEDDCDGHSDPRPPYPGYTDAGEHGMEIQRDRGELYEHVMNLRMENMCEHSLTPITVWEVASDREPTSDQHGNWWVKDARYVRTVNTILRSPELAREQMLNRALYGWDGRESDVGVRVIHTLDLLWFPHQHEPCIKELWLWLAENPCCSSCPPANKMFVIDGTKELRHREWTGPVIGMTATPLP